VPAELSSGKLEDCRQELERRLNSLYEEAWEERGRREH
jgi:hypothetical protein